MSELQAIANANRKFEQELRDFRRDGGNHMHHTDKADTVGVTLGFGWSDDHRNMSTGDGANGAAPKQMRAYPETSAIGSRWPPERNASYWEAPARLHSSVREATPERSSAPTERRLYSSAREPTPEWNVERSERKLHLSGREPTPERKFAPSLREPTPDVRHAFSRRETTPDTRVFEI